MLDEIRNARRAIIHDWQRRIFDAFMLPPEELEFPEKELREYVKLAQKFSGKIDWTTYDAQRESFLGLADRLLERCPPAEQAPDLKRRMYVRYMEGRIRYFEALEKQERCSISATPVGEVDFHNTALASVFAHLPEQPEVKEYLRDLDVSWDYDQLHMVTWFSGQLSLGSGKYSRSRPNHSAKVTYERLLNPFSLLWIAAALGANKDLVIQTRREMDDYVSWRAKCGVVRRAIPWKKIYELALPLAEKERNGL